MYSLIPQAHHRRRTRENLTRQRIALLRLMEHSSSRWRNVWHSSIIRKQAQSKESRIQEFRLASVSCRSSSWGWGNRAAAKQQGVSAVPTEHSRKTGSLPHRSPRCHSFCPRLPPPLSTWTTLHPVMQILIIRPALIGDSSVNRSTSCS